MIDIRIYRLRFPDSGRGIYEIRADPFFRIRRQDMDIAEPLHGKIRSFLMNCTDYTTKKHPVSRRNRGMHHKSNAPACSGVACNLLRKAVFWLKRLKQDGPLQRPPKEAPRGKETFPWKEKTGLI